MPQSLEERIAYLEGKVEEHSRGFGELREAIRHLDEKVDRFRQELAARIDALDQRMTAIDHKVDRFREELAARIHTLDQKVSRQFMWLVGIQIAVLLAVIGALLRA